MLFRSEYTDNSDSMRIIEKDLEQGLFEARFNKLIKSQPNEGQQYEESLTMFTPANPPPKVLCQVKVQFFKGFGFVFNKLTCVILQIPGVAAAGSAGTSSSSKVTKWHVTFSSASAESRKRKSQSVTIDAKSSEDDDALAGLNIPSKK